MVTLESFMYTGQGKPPLPRDVRAAVAAAFLAHEFTVGRRIMYDHYNGLGAWDAASVAWDATARDDD